MRAQVFIALLAGHLAACSAEPLPEECPPEIPDGVGDACGGDGECREYLRCDSGACRLPAATTGTPTDDTVTITFMEADLAFFAEQSRTRLQRERGLAGRSCVSDGWAMLFVFPDEEKRQFTMAGMRFSIDIAFADADGGVVAVRHRVKPGTPFSISSTDPAMYAVETPAGELAAVQNGDTLRID